MDTSDHADTFYVLGQLYEQVPGFPLSFGDVEASVSLGLKSVDLMEEQYRKGIEEEINYDYYTELAKHFNERDWSSAKRKRELGKMREKYESLSDPFEKNFYYEAAVEMENISDSEEANKIIQWVISELEE